MKKFYRSYEWNYLSFRFCIGLWVGIILIVCVATDASALVRYITRFTEENFALLIAVIFIKSAIEKLIVLGDEFPINKGDCYCEPKNQTEKELFGMGSNFLPENQTFSYNRFQCSVIISFFMCICIYKENNILSTVRFI